LYFNTYTNYFICYSDFTFACNFGSKLQANGSVLQRTYIDSWHFNNECWNNMKNSLSNNDTYNNGIFEDKNVYIPSMAIWGLTIINSTIQSVPVSYQVDYLFSTPHWHLQLYPSILHSTLTPPIVPIHSPFYTDTSNCTHPFSILHWHLQLCQSFYWYLY
jgi:hypothetical protein